MEIGTLRNFLTIAREENITRAAEILHITQPTLSRQIKALEEELGRKLFIRHSFNIELTDAGVLLRKQAEDMVAMADKISESFRMMDDITGGDVYLGLAESYQVEYLAEFIRRFKQKYPNLNYHITSGDTEQVTEKLDKGLLDFAGIVESPDYRKYNAMPFPEEDRWVAIVNEAHPLARLDHVTPEDLAGVPLFCSEQSWEKDIPRWAGSTFEQYRLEGSFRLSYNGSLFAKKSLGCLLTFDKLIASGGDTGLVSVPLSPTLTTPMYLIWKKRQVFTPIAERFLADFLEYRKE